MRRTRLVIAALITTAIAVPLVGDADGLTVLKNYRRRRLSGSTSIQSLPFTPPEDAVDCSPDFPGLPDAIGSSFDPDAYDLISVAGDGRYLAYATRIAAAGQPPAVKEIVRYKEGGEVQRIGSTDGGVGGNDQPVIELDRMGVRIAFRGLGAPDMTTLEQSENIYLQTETTVGTDPGTDTLQLTNVSLPLFARHPDLSTRTRTIVLKGDIKRLQRDARVTFVSNADLATRRVRIPNPDAGQDGEPAFLFVGPNEDEVPQVFLWRERPGVFIQITRNTDPTAEMGRPSMSGDGTAIAFESTADLDPDAANPLDATQVGNPDGARQIFVWRRGPGVRQLTWGSGDCYTPHISRSGRVILFSSNSDLVRGGNPERNHEIFAWRPSRNPTRRIRQLTQTTEGDSVFPHPSARMSHFVFYSTATPPKPVPGQATPGFGSGARQCAPHALGWTPRGVFHVSGTLDAENLAFVAAGDPTIGTGPPAVGLNLRKIHFATNDPQFVTVGVGGGDDLPAPNQLEFHIVRASKYAR